MISFVNFAFAVKSLTINMFLSFVKFRKKHYMFSRVKNLIAHYHFHYSRAKNETSGTTISFVITVIRNSHKTMHALTCHLEKKIFDLFVISKLITFKLMTKKNFRFQKFVIRFGH